MTNIDFTQMTENTFVLSGKEKGIATRKKFALDALDADDGAVDVIIPQELEIMTPSFVAGMFAASVRRLGSVDAFFRKYRFNASSRIIDQVKDGAKSSLLTGSALSRL